MKPYIDLLSLCARTGARQKNRTGIDTFMIPGGMMQFDLGQGFPILTTKKVNFGAVVAELLGFIRGVDSAAAFRALGTKIWDANANQNEAWLKNPNRRGPDDLGRIYGKQWRNWRALGSHVGEVAPHFSVREIDQLRNALTTIQKDPQSRRIIVSAWNPGDLDRMALPPCHLLFQFLVSQEEGKLNACMYMRSCDMFLGVPFNISSYALLLSLVAIATGLKPGVLTMFLADVHIYENHLAQVNEQLQRNQLSRPKLVVHGGSVPENPIEWLEELEPSDIELLDYDPHPAIRADMAV